MAKWHSWCFLDVLFSGKRCCAYLNSQLRDSPEVRPYIPSPSVSCPVLGNHYIFSVQPFQIFSMVTLDEIEADLKRLDPAGILNGVAYSKSFNTRLGVAPYATKPFDFSVFIPWGSWDVYNHRNDSPPPKIPSQFGIAIQQVITAGVKDPSGQVDNKTCFIDLVHLGNPDTTFMTEANGEWPGVVQTLAKYVDQMDPEMTPVIRFLTGSAEREPKPSVATQSSYLDSFWPNGSSVFRHKKAMLYIGYYNPNFK